MTFSASLRASRATIVIMVIIGMVWGALAGLVPDIKAITGVSDAGLGSAMMFSAAGSMTAMYFAPRYFQYMQRRALPVAGLFVVAAFFYPALQLLRLAWPLWCRRPTQFWAKSCAQAKSAWRCPERGCSA